MDRRVWVRWLVGLSAVALIALAGVYVYDLGVARGLAESGRFAAGGDAPSIGWWRPWHSGFGFFPLFPFFFVLLWLFVIRGLFWRGPWYRRRWYGRGWRDERDRVPPAFEEWHRRAHDARQRHPDGNPG